MNLGIPGARATDPIAFILAKEPENLQYCNKYGGHLNLILERGHIQKHILVSGAGPNFYFGGTTNYYMHDRNAIHLQQHSDLSNTYKLLVHSHATFHFRCQPPINYDSADTFDVARREQRVPINYRYEGDFNIEQVTVKGQGPKEILDKYNLGIHGIRQGRELRIKAGKISLQYISDETPHASETTATTATTATTPTATNDMDDLFRELQAAVLQHTELVEAVQATHGFLIHEDERVLNNRLIAKRNEIGLKAGLFASMTSGVNRGTIATPPKTKTSGPKIELSENSVNMTFASDKYITVDEKNLVLKYGKFSIIINNSGIEFKSSSGQGSEPLLSLKDAEMKMRDSVQIKGCHATFRTGNFKRLNGKSCEFAS
jgi:hypothetical protein